MKTTAQYDGPICRRGHINDRGYTTRNENSKCCVECAAIATAKRRARNGYTEYQREYHQKLRAENPTKAKEYYETQKARGHTNPVKTIK